MNRVTARHELDCSVDRFWELYFDEAFTRTMLWDGLGYATKLGPIERTDIQWKRSMVVTPRLVLPEAVLKLVGPALSYTENGTYDTVGRRWVWDTKLGVFTDRILLGGTMWAEPLGERRCRRVAELWVDAKVFGIGGLVEKAAVKNLHIGWSGAAEWINGWLARNPASG